MTKLTVTIEEASASLSLSRSTIYNLFKAGKITPRKSGKRVLILQSDLEAYIDSLPVAEVAGAHSE